MADQSSLALYLGLGVVASTLLAGGLLMMKSRSSALPPAHGRAIFNAILRWIRDPVWIGGLGVQTLGYAVYVAALSNAPVSLVAVMMQGGIALFVIFAVVFLLEQATPLEWTGIVGILAAMVMLAFSLNAGAAGSAANVKLLSAFTAISLVVAGIPFATARIRRGGIATAIASGIAFGLGSLFTKPLADTFAAHASAGPLLRMFIQPWLYLVSAANIAGLILLQNSFHAGRGIIAMPLSSAVSNLVPIVGGMIAFGEVLPAEPTAAWLRIAAFALMVGSSALLATGDEVV
jgi:multidrug transporter EmrE-like cation transporter